jgi:hypothetical protein
MYSTHAQVHVHPKQCCALMSYNTDTFKDFLTIERISVTLVSPIRVHTQTSEQQLYSLFVHVNLCATTSNHIEILTLGFGVCILMLDGLQINV